MKGISSFMARRLPDFVLLIYLLAATIGAFNGGLWAGLGISAGLVLFFGVWLLNRRAPIPDKNLALIAGVLFAVTAILNFNSSQPTLSWHEWARLLTVFVPLLLLLSPPIPAFANHPRFFTVIPIAMLIAGLVLSAVLYIETPIGRDDVITEKLAKYNRGFSHLALLALPMMAALWHSKNRWTIILFVLLLFIPASLTESRTSKLALVLALMVTALAYVRPVLTRRLLTLTPFAAIGWPFAARWIFAHHYDWLGHLPDSWRARIEIWDYMSYRIMERPWLGWGLGTSITLDFKQPHGALYVIMHMAAGHPHNVMTQLWVELGVPGLALGLVFALLTLQKASRLDARLVPFALGAWTAAFCFCLIAYNFWTDSLFAAFALTAFAFLLLERKLISPRSSRGAQEAH